MRQSTGTMSSVAAPDSLRPEGDSHLARGLATAIGRLRQKLLDVGKRNKLINAPIGKERAKQLTIEDELSDEVFRILHLENGSMTFEPFRGVNPPDSEDEEDDDSLFLPLEEGGGQADPIADQHVDRRLHTRLSAARLQRKLLVLYRDARSLEEEQGISVLFLALGFLRWYESESSEVERFAPLILLPVDLVRERARGKFRLVYRDQDLEPNLSLRALLESDFGLTLPDFPEGEGWLPTEYFVRVQSAVAPKARWRVRPNTIELSFFSFAKFLMWRDLSAGEEAFGTANNELVERLLVEGFSGSASIFAPDERLDERFADPRDLGHILDADASQTQVIAAAREGRNLVVQGPPGTGKSQTIANIIAVAAREGKRVLFVAEKRAALDVVHARLERCGLGPLCLELHSHKANRKEVYAELRSTLALGAPTHIGESEYRRVQGVRDELNELSDLLHRVDGETGETPYLVIGRISELSEQGCARPGWQIPGAECWSRAEYDKRVEAVEALSRMSAEHILESTHTWRGARRRMSLPDRRALSEELGRALELLDDLRAALRAGAAAAAVKVAETPGASETVLGHLDALSAKPARVAPLLERPAVLEELPSVARLVSSIVEARRLREELLAEVVESALNRAWDDERIEIASRGRSLSRWFSGAYRRSLGRLRAVQRNALPRSLTDQLAQLDRMIEHRRAVTSIRTKDALGREALGRAWAGEETDVSILWPAVQWITSQAAELGSVASVRKQVSRSGDPDALARAERILRKAAEGWAGCWAAISDLVDLDVRVAFSEDDIGAVRIDVLVERLTAWMSDPGSIEGWHRLSAAARQLTTLGLGQIRERIGDGGLGPGDATSALAFVRAEAVWNRMRSDAPKLGTIDGADRSRKVELFKELDQRLQALAAHEVAIRHFEAIPLGSAGQVGVVRGELAKKMRHMPIRKLLNAAGEAVVRIKPVFLMSPLSVAQYLAPGGLTFDLLLIDEASQVRPADAMGAILRSSQVVVVGDQKQMPPTSFFDREVGDSVDPDELEDLEDIQAAQVSDMESILSLCESRSMAGGMLRWHYRSRHPSLIEVSNHEFYDHGLICPPSPEWAPKSTGLGFIHVEGCYERGRKRNNPVEAQTVADQVLKHARHHPDDTLGVVALSIAQRNTIADKLEVMRAQHPELEAFCKESKDAPFFVKNLENVQGDERDVIFISICYGRDKAGYMSQSFGPVSNEGGERRLNVLFTRAKKRCTVFASIRHSDIRLDTTKHAGPRVLKRFLKYAETGELDIPVLSGAAADSPFEEAVAAALQSHGHRVSGQVGSAGFRIDLAVHDPDDEGRFLLAVECDGARYHSSSWARERDRLRQAVLEQKGWTFHRIWSTDWFYDRDRELARLLEAVERVRNMGRSAAEPKATETRARVERVHADGPPEREGVPYVEASFNIAASAFGPLPEADESTLAECVARIVETEGPVHIEEVVRRLSRLWGHGRSGSRIQRAVEAAVNDAVEVGRVGYPEDSNGVFVDRPDRSEDPPPRDRTLAKSQWLRKPAMLPPTEVRSAILEAVERNIGIRPADCAREAARMLGIRRVSGEMREVFVRQARELVASGRLSQLRDELRLP